MGKTRDWMSAREAVQRLDVKLPTLYSYVSRGLVESVPSPGGRARLYAAADVERLKARHDARAGHSAVAASALRWGEPTFTTGISDIRADGPCYRGLPLATLLRDASSFECVAELLLTGSLPRQAAPARIPAALLRAVPRRAAKQLRIAQLAVDVALLGLSDASARTPAADLARARWLWGWLAGRGAPQRQHNASVAARLYESLTGRVLAERAAGTTQDAATLHCLDRALILCADHELNVSTLAVRAAASSGADLYACVAAALHVLSGAHHGGVSARVEALLATVAKDGSAARVVRGLLARGQAIPGFGHRLYPAGDPRCEALLALAESAPRRVAPRLVVARALCTAMKAARQPAPNLDLGLTALSAALGLPRGSAGIIFAVGRTAGWVAHAFEQRAQAFILRPRARYVPSPASPPDPSDAAS